MEIKMLKELDRLSSKRDSKNKNCLFRNYDSEKCNDEPLIKSHSISNSIFKEIKEPLVSVEIITKDRKIERAEIRDVTNKFGIFNNFICKVHDNKVFEKIERKEKNENYGTSEQHFLFCLKASLKHVLENYDENFKNFGKKKEETLKKICEYINKNINENVEILKKESIKIISNNIEEEQKQYLIKSIIEVKFLSSQELLNYFKINYEYSKNDNSKFNQKFEENKKYYAKFVYKMLSIYKNKDFDTIETKIIYLPKKYPVACNSLSLLSGSFENQNDIIFFSIFPTNDRTVCLVSWFKENKKYPELLINNLKNNGKKDTVLNLMMKTANVVYGKNFLLEKLEGKEKKFLSDYLRLQRTKIDLSDYFLEGINDTYEIF